MAEPLTAVHSVDGSPDFVRSLLEDRWIARAEQAGRLVFHIGDLSPLGSRWGTPAHWNQRPPELQAAQARAYVQAVGPEQCCFDTIFIDGRFREACSLQALRLLRPDKSIVLMHDWRTAGHHAVYRAGVSRWFTARHSADEKGKRRFLVVLTPKPGSVDEARALTPRYRESLANASRHPE
jgi:hypothetical protein